MNILISIGVILVLLAVTPQDIQSRLKAIEDAHKAGVLTDEEYASKKAELEAQLKATTLDEATRQKLQALETARQSGILSDEEYARKKAELLGQQAAPVGPGANLALYRDPQGLFQFQHPPDWTAKAFPNGQGVALTRGQAAISLMLFPKAAAAQGLLEAVTGQIRGQWQDYRELRRSERKTGGQATPLVEFTGVNPQGIRAHSQITVLVAGETGYIFLLSAPENEFANAQPAWETLLNSFGPVGKKGKTYQHDLGFSFWYPEDWTVTKQEDILQLAPPNPGSTAEGPTELYFVTGESVSEENIQRPDDPRVIEYLDTQIQSLSPTLKRTGSVLPIDMKAGKGVALDWEAKSPRGDEIRARAFVSIIKDYGLMLIALGRKDLLEARDPDLRQIFASFGFGEAQSPITSSTSHEQGPVGTASSPTISANEVGDPGWGFKFQPPSGWKSQKTPQGIILGHDTTAGMILVLPHTAAGFQEVQGQMQQGLAEEGVQLSLTGGLQSLGSNVIAGEYSGIFNGQQVKARGIGTLSPHGGGAYIIALTMPDKYGPQLSGAADAIARGMQYFKVEVSDLMQHFSGTWVNYTSNTQTTFTLSPDGSYSENYESSYSGNFKNQYGDQTGAWGTGGQSQSAGRWTVRGNKQQGSIIITSQDGSQTVLEYQVHTEKGQTYWNEYLFNGKLYGKKQ